MVAMISLPAKTIFVYKVALHLNVLSIDPLIPVAYTHQHPNVCFFLLSPADTSKTMRNTTG
jgi:hypothetical protein